MEEVDKISIKRPMKTCTGACIRGIRDSVHHNTRMLEILDDNGSYDKSCNLRTEMLEELLAEIRINEMMIVNQLMELNNEC